jgi:hypothetical protein
LNRLGAAIETYAIDKHGERVFLGLKKNPCGPFGLMLVSWRRPF